MSGAFLGDFESFFLHSLQEDCMNFYDFDPVAAKVLPI
ncbi:hypothetical protein LEP1GSC043_0273 [Leptospira weilii str. Ecochallenge]|uniref:Uncharacterized protein n=2 Tax=Leptospira weilii TaxID=28184 RepID=N1U5T3_9LEPT|nr:hypothetical protein LEP1GSC038_3877 [Leptospira weilii str. 2006001855]EMY14367.1 hypothetical protein LEP1GSC043_0273 [Leptospira weilii str. Ecochallenge]